MIEFMTILELESSQLNLISNYFWIFRYFLVMAEMVLVVISFLAVHTVNRLTITGTFIKAFSVTWALVDT